MAATKTTTARTSKKRASKKTVKRTTKKASTKKKAPAKKTAKRAAKKASTKAPAKKAAPSKANGAGDPSAFTPKQITNAIRSLSKDEMEGLHKELLGRDVPRNKKKIATVTGVKLSGIIAKAIAKAGAIPASVLKALKPKRSRGSGPRKPSLVDKTVELLQRPKGASLGEVGTMIRGTDGRGKLDEKKARHRAIDIVWRLGHGWVKRYLDIVEGRMYREDDRYWLAEEKPAKTAARYDDFKSRPPA